MSTYTYSLSKDFTSSHQIDDVKFIHDLQLQSEITTPLVNIDKQGDNVIFKFDHDLSEREQELLLEIIHNHDSCDTIYDRLVILSDEKEKGVHGGSVEKQKWLTRDLNKDRKSVV